MAASRDLSLLHVRQQTPKVRPVEAGPGVAAIHIEPRVGEVVLSGVRFPYFLLKMYCIKDGLHCLLYYIG